jgi:hypothetical protein
MVVVQRTSIYPHATPYPRGPAVSALQTTVYSTQSALCALLVSSCILYSGILYSHSNTTRREMSTALPLESRESTVLEYQQEREGK